MRHPSQSDEVKFWSILEVYLGLDKSKLIQELHQFKPLLFSTTNLGVIYTFDNWHENSILLRSMNGANLFYEINLRKEPALATACPCYLSWKALIERGNTSLILLKLSIVLVYPNHNTKHLFKVMYKEGQKISCFLRFD